MDQRASFQRAAAALFACVLVFAPMISAGCREGRLPVCETDADCAVPDAGTSSRICYNLRCVECRYDTDCPVGKVCSGANTCDALDKPPAKSDDDKKNLGWDPNSWDECAKGCKDASCIQDCDRRFQKP